MRIPYRISDPRLPAKFLELLGDPPSPDQCWPWPRAMGADGYGRMCVKRLNGSWALTPAHRLSWVVFYGDDPSPAHVLHNCDNKSCVNPRHLHLGDEKMNMAEAIERGLLDPRKGKTAFTPSVVREIRERRASGASVRVLSRDHGVSASAISSMCTGRTFADWPGPLVRPWEMGRR